MDHGDLSSTDQKRSILRKLMAEHNVVRLFISSAATGVILPRKCFDNPVANIDIGYGMHKPMGAFDDNARIEATLSFGGVPFRCIIPWDSIFGIGPEPDPQATAFWPAFAPGLRVRVVERDLKPENAQGAQVVSLADFRKKASAAGPTKRLTPPRRAPGDDTPPLAS